MKYLVSAVILLLMFSINTHSQQIVRGYSAGYSYGFLSYSSQDSFSFSLLTDDTREVFNANVYDAIGSSIFVGFPFEWGHNRHRIELLPAVSIETSDYFLSSNFTDIYENSTTDSLSIRVFSLLPQVGFAYKFHFGLGSIHLALSAGVDIRFPVLSDYSLRYGKENFLEIDEQYQEVEFDFANAPSLNNMSDITSHISPKAGLDIYLSRFLVLSLQYHRTPLTENDSDAVLVGCGLAKMSYLVPMGKDDRIRSLQQYKNQ